MLDQAVLAEYFKLKNERDISYKIFKRKPSAENASKHTIAVQNFTNFCVENMAALADDNESNRKEEILSKLADYKSCKTCGADLLYIIDEQNYIERNDFVAAFPGLCFDCLTKHCSSTSCEACDLVEDSAVCGFKELKNI